MESIPGLQEGTSQSTQNFAKFFAYYFVNAIVALPFLATYSIVKQRARSFYYLLLTCASLALTSFTKLVFLQPRPFWVSEDIQAFDCRQDYGGPELAMVLAVALTHAVWLDYNACASAQQQNDDSAWSSWWVRAALLLLGEIFCVLVGFTCFFTGANSSG